MNDDERDAKLAELENRIRILENYHEGGVLHQNEPKETLERFLSLPSIRGNDDKTLAIAYYLEFYEHKSPITRADIKQGYITGRESPPRNISDTFYRNFNKDYFMNGNSMEDGTKTLIVTKKGKAEIEEMIRKGKEPV